MTVRALAMDALQPTGKQDIPYPDVRSLRHGLLKLVPEVFTGTLTGAGGVGAFADVPFDVAYVEFFNPAGTPISRRLFVGAGVQLNGITCAAATGLSVANDAASLPRRVTAAVAILANADVAQFIAYGWRNVSGNL